MAIPVYLQQFKAAGIYRIVFDKSTISGVDSNILRLVVGYSEVGPFNIPVYVTSPTDFKAIFGDVSKKLEKRGVFFHRMALQALSAGPILALNLKNFDGETVDGATINTDFNPSFEIIDTVKLNVEDIYDTSRFWELSADKLNGLKSVSGAYMDQYINICATNTKETSGTYFIRKANGSKVNGYNITVSDWYSDEELPEYLEPFKNSLISDFMAEIYLFKGKFTKAQVLASSTLKNYFEATGVGDEIKLRSFVTNAYGDNVDTLDALYNDETSGAIAHYVGSLIPYFKNKQGAYAALDILFNADNDVHNMMMSFNIDMLEDEYSAHIDLSGRLSVAKTQPNGENASNLTLESIFNGEATTSLLGNKDSRVVVDKVEYANNVVKLVDGKYVPFADFDNSNPKRVTGALYVSNVVDEDGVEGNEGQYEITLKQVGQKTREVEGENNTTRTEEYTDSVNIVCESHEQLWSILAKLKAKKDGEDDLLPDGYGTVYTLDSPVFCDKNGKFVMDGPKSVITSITRLETTMNAGPYTSYKDDDTNMKVSTMDVVFTLGDNDSADSVYGSSVTFLPVDSSVWQDTDINGVFALANEHTPWDTSIFSSISVGDCFLADDGSTDRDSDGEVDDEDGYFDNVYVQEVGTLDNGDGTYTYYIKFSGKPYTFVSGADDEYLVRVDSALNKEIGTMVPQFLGGYSYRRYKPESTKMVDKLDWQNFILGTLTKYSGLRTALLNKSDIDYRYVIDTFETYVEEGTKKVLSYLAKQKETALALLNFPSVRTFVKCPYTSFTDSQGIFRVEYVVAGFNKKKPAGKKFSLPTDSDGASFAAFYTPVKLSDGYVDTIVPSAALVSNLFMTKYTSRQPYYIVAGPNYARIEASGLVGPDYTYSMDELQVIEPFGVNALVYRPGFGTFVNANQTAKQTPVSALSKVNIRELVIFLQVEVEKVLQAYQWEFNNPTTRNAILNKANFICARVAANGGLQTYLNVMDESNNTPEIIDNEMAILSTHIEPGMGCGKMIHELTLYKTGQMASNIIES